MDKTLAIKTIISLIILCVVTIAFLYLIDIPNKEMQKMNDETIEQATIDCAMKCIDLDMYYSDSIYRNQVDKIIMQYNAKGNNVTLKDWVCGTR